MKTTVRKKKKKFVISLKSWNFITPLLLFVIAISLGIINVSNQANYFRNNLINETETSYHNFIDDIQNKFSNINSTLKDIMHTSFLQDLNNLNALNQSNSNFNKIKTFFLYILQNQESMYELRLINKTGFEVFKLEKLSDGNITQNEILENKNFTTYFNQAKTVKDSKDRRLILNSNINLKFVNNSNVIPTVLTLRFFIPLYNTNNTFNGIFIVNFDFSKLISSFINDLNNPDLHPFIADEQGNYLFHYNENKTLIYTTNHNQKNYDMFNDYRISNESFKQDRIYYFNKKVESFPSPFSLYFSKNNEVGTFYKINIRFYHSFYLYLGFNYSIKNHFNSLINFTLVSILILTFLFIIFLSVIYLTNIILIQKPINDIGKVLNHIRREEFDIEVTPSFILEFNDIGENLSSVRDSLQSKKGEIKSFIDEIENQKKYLEFGIDQRTKELNELLKRYSWIFDNAGDGIIVFEIDPNLLEESIIDVNKTFYQRLEYQKEEFMNLKIKDFSNPKMPIKKILSNLINKKSDSVTSIHIAKSGREIQVEIKSNIYEEQGRIYAISIVRDISERNKNLMLIKKFSELVEQATNSIAIINRNGIIEYANRSFINNSGYAKEDLISNSYDKTLTNESKLIYKKIIDEILGEDKNWKGELLHLKPNQNLFWTMTSISKLFDNKNHFTNFFIIEDDITPLKILTKQLEEKSLLLFEEKTKVELILNSVPFGVMVIQEGGSLLLINNAFNDLLWNEYSLNLTSGLELNQFRNNQLVGKILRKVENNHHNTEIFNLESNTYLEITFSVINTSPHKNLYLVVIKNITEFVEFELLQKQFISTVSHELRTPIASILLSINNYRKYQEKLTLDQKVNLLDIITRCSTLLKSIVEDLLILSRIDSKKLDFRSWDTIDVLKELNNLIFELDHQIREKNLTIKVLSESNPTIYGDIERFRQIIRIVLDNAIKYSFNDKKIDLEIVENYQGEYNKFNDPGILISIRDYGIGIPKYDKKFIGKRFFRGTNAKNVQGTGVGISILNELINLFRGYYYIPDLNSTGTLFVLFFPLIKKSD